MSQTVLVIDDSPDVHALLGVRLAPEGLELRHAFDPAEGLQMAKSTLPDLILLDVVMPGQTGFELCEQFKNDPATAQIPVIFLTGSAECLDKVHGLDLGAVDYITKPFAVGELRARVRAALRTKRYADLLAQRAQIDALTGLPNRAFFDSRLDQELAAARRYSRSVSLLLLDLDHFKQVNDTCGHPYGDRVLQSVGELIQQLARETDSPSRYGGEEFAIILTETSLDKALQAAERFRSQIASLSWQHRQKSIRVTSSVGVACTSQQLDSVDAATPKGLLAAADAALYRAKELGRNRVEPATPHDFVSELATPVNT